MKTIREIAIERLSSASLIFGLCSLAGMITYIAYQL
jgi:hypothetical protein